MLLLVSLAVAVVFFVAFVIAVKRGQYDDVNTPAIRLLFDNDNRACSENDSDNEPSCKTAKQSEN